MTEAAKATERAVAAMGVEFGLLDASQVAKLLGGVVPTGLLVVQQDGEALYPGFQFDQQARQVKPIITELLELADLKGRTSTGVALWLTSGTTYLAEGIRPVDLLDREPEQVLEVARQAWGIDW